MKFVIVRQGYFVDEDAPPDLKANHETINLKSGINEKVWTIDLNSLDDLINFIDKNGEVTIKKVFNEIYLYIDPDNNEDCY